MKKYLVIKSGGSILDQLPDSFYQTIKELSEGDEWQPVLVHGGGPHISHLLTQLDVPIEFNSGLRVTSEAVLDIVEMVLCGSVNKQIVRNLANAGAKALGISGMDGSLLYAEPMDKTGSLGYVGEVTKVEPSVIQEVVSLGYVPVVAPLALGENGQRYNINGDLAAAAVAKALNGSLCFVSNIDGVLAEEKGERSVIPELTQEEASDLIVQGIIYGGMIPKVQSALDSLFAGAQEVVILNGLKEQSLREFTEGKPVGTRFVKASTKKTVRK
ncbi:acetylglutamate kinase [Pullulanibacillus sp. KACC 23026]|uniref:acetylglutamate kinase n=1 Tax=Pullulanibacillus sp. KACC 23026 TaxID=3028315 RepID=UPI0023AEABF6|nr:acetylglutamate kinase [Pullulanibacillus sp. KACC 23026]WEG13065.1 acetylglutamate kinase [Pullulanibacillus sp. KACC 23026]